MELWITNSIAPKAVCLWTKKPTLWNTGTRTYQCYESDESFIGTFDLSVITQIFQDQVKLPLPLTNEVAVIRMALSFEIIKV